MKKNYILSVVLVLIFSLSFGQSNESWPEMIKVDGGTCMVGATKKDQLAENDERPQHKVTVSTFYMSKFEVTVWDWKEYCKATGATMPPKQSWGWNDDFPITNITWEDAVQYCNWLSKKQGFTPVYTRRGPRYVCNFKANGFRLPTEAEWEYAARGGNKSENYRYAGGNDLDLISWNVLNSEGRPHAYGSKYPNELGIYDLTGNVWEWCWDFYNKDHFRAIKKNPMIDPNFRGPIQGEKHIVKGGSWDSKQPFCRISNKVATLSGNTHKFYGMRLVQTNR